MSKSRPAVMNCSSCLIATSYSAASSPIASISPGVPIASGKPDTRMSTESSSLDAASTSQVRMKDAYLGGSMEKQLRLRSGTTRGNKLRGTPCPEQESLGATHCLSPHIAGHIALHGSRLFHGQGNLWKQPGDCDVNLAIWRMFMNTTLRAAVHLGKGL